MVWSTPLKLADPGVRPAWKAAMAVRRRIQFSGGAVQEELVANALRCLVSQMVDLQDRLPAPSIPFCLPSPPVEAGKFLSRVDIGIQPRS
jgi:hypothetical protein